MTLHSSLLILLALICVVPPAYLTFRLVNWVAGRKIAPLWILPVLVIGLFAGGSMLLDRAGTIVSATVVDRSEEIRYRRNGGWHRGFGIQVEYQAAGTRAPEVFALSADSTTYDAVQVGQRIDVRHLDLGEWLPANGLDLRQHLKFVRLKHRSTFSPFIDPLFRRSPRGPWREATAIVREIRHIDKYRVRGSPSWDLRWPFDIVQFEFTVPGRAMPFVGVDTLEASSLPGVVRGGPIQVRWPEDDPRSAQIAGGLPGSMWRNELYHYSLFIGLTIALFVPLGLWARRRRQRRARAT